MGAARVLASLAAPVGVIIGGYLMMLSDGPSHIGAGLWFVSYAAMIAVAFYHPNKKED